VAALQQKTRKRSGVAGRNTKTIRGSFGKYTRIAYFDIGENSSEISSKSAFMLSPERLTLPPSDKNPKAEPDKLLKPPPPRPGIDP
jgi:hypothetical protein